MKKSLASLELTAIINELQPLTKSVVSQIYHPEQKTLFLQLHSTSVGKKIIKIIAGKVLCLTSTKEANPAPSSFCMQLRKYLDHAYLKSIHQHDAERIVILELEKKEKYYLIIEMFSKGNIIFTDHNYLILGLAEQQVWKDRTLKAKETYQFPHPSTNWKTISETQLWELIKKSEKKNLATALAIELGLGGTYAEELCTASNVDKNKKPVETSSQETKTLYKTLQHILISLKHPKGYAYVEEITPFPLTYKVVIQETPTYNEAIDTIKFEEKKSPFEKKILAIQKMITSQQESILNFEQEIIANNQKAELIYQHYTPLLKLLTIVTEMRKTKEWKEIAQELKKEKKIKRIDLKNKKVVLDL